MLIIGGYASGFSFVEFYDGASVTLGTFKQPVLPGQGAPFWLHGLVQITTDKLLSFAGVYGGGGVPPNDYAFIYSRVINYIKHIIQQSHQ